MNKHEAKHIEAEIGMRVLRNGLLICGCLLLIPAFNITFQGAAAIYMIIMSLNIDEF